MKKLVSSAIALSLTSAVGFANGSGDDWSVLDREVEALTTSSLSLNDDLEIGGYLKTRYENGDGIGADAATAPTMDVGGFNVDDGRLKIRGNRGDYGFKVQYDLADSQFLDGYIQFPLGGLRGKIGQFKSPILRSSNISGQKLVLNDRTFNGSDMSTRDEGLMISGEYDALGWALAAQNGSDDAADDLLITARLDLSLTGDKVAAKNEGAYGGPDSFAALLGVALFDDGATVDGDGIALEFYAMTNIYSIGVDAVDHSAGGFVTRSSGPVPANAMAKGNTTPIGFTGTYMLAPDAWELAIRYQDLDDTMDSNQVDVGINHYIDGHDLKVQLQVTSLDSDAVGIQRDYVTLGMTAGF